MISSWRTKPGIKAFLDGGDINLDVVVGDTGDTGAGASVVVGADVVKTGVGVGVGAGAGSETVAAVVWVSVSVVAVAKDAGDTDADDTDDTGDTDGVVVADSRWIFLDRVCVKGTDSIASAFPTNPNFSCKTVVLLSSDVRPIPVIACWLSDFAGAIGDAECRRSLDPDLDEYTLKAAFPFDSLILFIMPTALRIVWTSFSGGDVASTSIQKSCNDFK